MKAGKRFTAALSVCAVILASDVMGQYSICLDPGHGGIDIGTPGPGGLIDEKEVNLRVALSTRDSLLWWNWFNVSMTRTTDQTILIEERTSFVNNAFGGFGFDFLISIHHNSAGQSPCYVQGTEVWHCRSDTVYGSGGQYRAVDTLMAKKIYLRLVEQWDAPDDPYVARGLKHSCALMLLKWTKMISCLTEASFLCDPFEEQLFADSASGHTEQEASAIFRGFRSYWDNMGVALITNRYVDGDGGYIEVDYVPLTSPIERTWEFGEQHNIYTRVDFWDSGYYYQFSHWAHLLSDGTYIGPGHYGNEWNIVVPAEFGYHIYRAYFTGGPYYASMNYIQYWKPVFAVGDVIQFTWSAHAGVDSTTVVDLYLDRNHGQSGYPEPLAYEIAWRDAGYFDWIVSGPDAQGCRTKIVARDIAGNTTTAYSPSIDEFDICSWLVGDANGDGEITVGDGVYLVDHIFDAGPPPVPHWGSGDSDCNKLLTIGDAVYLATYLFGGGPAPACDCSDYPTQRAVELLEQRRNLLSE